MLLGVTIAAFSVAANVPAASAAPREAAGSQLALVDQQGRFLTWVDSVVGANDRLTVMEEQLNADRHFHLHSGGLAPEVLILRLPAVAPTPAVQNWLGLPTLGTSATWQTGAVVLVDGSGQIVEKYSFDGVLLGMILPGPDVSKPGALTPFTVFLTLGHGTRSRTAGGSLAATGAPARLAKLRYAVTGLDASHAEAGAPLLISCSADFDDARAVELLNNPTQTSADAVGVHRDTNVTPLVVRPIHVTLALTQSGPANVADAWRQWQAA